LQEIRAKSDEFGLIWYIFFQTGVAKNFDWKERGKWKKLATFFCSRTSDDVIADFLKFNFVIISLKNTIRPNHATSDHQNRRLKSSHRSSA